MIRQSRRSMLTFVVLAAGALAACDQATSPLAPTGPSSVAGSSAAGTLSSAGGRQGGNQCAFGFSVTFDDNLANKLRSDGRAYVDGQDKVMASTGSGPGFRLDTNGGSQRLEGAGGVRTLLIDFNGVVGVPPAPFLSANKGVDLRFYLNDGGLDVCSLKSVGSSGTVGLTVMFEVLGKTGDTMTLTYGVPKTSNQDPDIIGQRVVVTRTGNSPDTWTVIGQTAGLRDGYQYGTVVAGNLTMPFKMTLVKI